MLHPCALLDAKQSRQADQDAIAGGIASETLMRNAANGVFLCITRISPPCPVLVICGEGNNGGDARIVARLLQEQGWEVKTCSIDEFTPALLVGKQLIVDGLFGTGLSRDIEGKAKAVIEAVNASGVPVVSIDIASGIDASTGEVKGATIHATHTVTFFCPKLGHVLLPGKLHTGKLEVIDIGISGEKISSDYFLNSPILWKNVFPRLTAYSHKYTRGHTLVMGGELSSTGASRLAAVAALRIGSGLVSIACTSETLPIYATALMSVMTKVTNTASELETLLEDPRITASLIGPGTGVHEKTHENVLQILSHKKPCVIDADAISSFKNNPKTLFSAIEGPVVLTPHEGEFARIFSAQGTRIERARAAAKQSGAVVVFKGHDTVIASPDGRIAINANAPPWLATAGTGDVLSGMIAGLLAQGMPVWEAACAGVGIHGEAANMCEVGMIAEDLPQAIPSVLKFVYSQ